MYTKQQLPGIGASLGLDRLLAAMEELGLMPQVATPAQVLITYFDKDQLATYLRWPPSCVPLVWAWNSIPNRNGSANS